MNNEGSRLIFVISLHNTMHNYGLRECTHFSKIVDTINFPSLRLAYK